MLLHIGHVAFNVPGSAGLFLYSCSQCHTSHSRSRKMFGELMCIQVYLILNLHKLLYGIFVYLVSR